MASMRVASPAVKECVITKHAWVVVADSPFLPARGGGEREHLGFVRAALADGHLILLIVPSSAPLPLAPYRELLGDVPVLMTSRREHKLLLMHPTRPYVVASRPVQDGLVDRVRELAPLATGVVVFSYKSWRIGEAVARGLGVPAVLRQHNLEGAYHRSLAEGSTGLRKLVLGVEARRIERDERRLENAAWLQSMADISATDTELRRRRGGNAVHVPPFAYDASLLELDRKPETPPRVLFIGALDVTTNLDALEWLLGGVWQTVRDRVPGAVLDVVGRRPSTELRQRLIAQPGVHLHADVPDMHPFLVGASVAVNPAVSGSGVNIKLVDYLLAGVPVVSTTLGSQGLGMADGGSLVVRDDPASFGEALAELLTDRDRAEELGASGRDHVRGLLNPPANIRRLEAELIKGAEAPPGRSTGGRPKVTVEVADLDELAGPDREEWDELFASQTGMANPFCAPEWVETWYQHFTAPEDRHLLVVRRGEELIGVAPFHRHRVMVGRAGIAERLILAGAGQGGSLLELPQVLTAPDHAREVLRAVVADTIKGHLPGGRHVDWAEIAIPQAHGWFEPEWSYSTADPKAFYRPQMARASVVLPLAADWASTRTALKRNLKESLRRSRNRLARSEQPSTVVEHSADLEETHIDKLLALHRQRSLHDASVAHEDAFADPRRQAFLRDLLPRLGRAGRASLVELHLGDNVVAVQLALFAPGVTHFHTSGMDARVWSLGPVTFLQEHLVKEAAERGDRWVNFSPGPNVAKLRWSEQLDVHHDFAYGSGGRSLPWKYGAFAAGQAMSQVGHAVVMSGANQAPARAQDPTGSARRG